MLVNLKNKSKSLINPKSVSTSRPLKFLHLDLFGPIQIVSLGDKRYCLVIVDDYSRYTLVIFLAHKDDTLKKKFP